jgi:tetratricopeptide (TPR) repeat protein
MPKGLTDKQKHYIQKQMNRLSIEQMARAVKVSPEAVASFIQSLPPKNPGKEALFKTGALLLSLILIVLFEIILRLFHYGGDQRLFLPMKGDMARYYRINNQVARRYFFMQKRVPTPGRDLFLKEKPADCTRIFVMGGSTAAGYPYGNNLMFSRILAERLTAVFPDRLIEVVNVAMAAVNSYTLLDFTDEIIAQRPDLVLIYAGHNEFYGALGVGSMESIGRNPGLVRAILKLEKFRIFLLLRNGAGLLRKGSGRAASGSSEADPTATLMARIVGSKSIPYESPLYRLGLAQFEGNLQILIKKMTKADVTVVLSELVSNIRDQEPFISVPTENFPEAKIVFNHAKASEKQGDYTQAGRLYTQAKDLDALRFRASEEFNQLIHKLARQYSIAVVPMKILFEQASDHGLVGDALMTDHLHPNIRGCFLLADGFFQTLRTEGLIASVWDSSRVRPSSFYEAHWPVTALDSASADLSVLYLKGSWPFRPENEVNQTLSHYHPSTLEERLALKVLTDPEVNLEKAHLELAEYFSSKKQYDRAFREYRALMTMVPHEMEFYEGAVKMCLQSKKYPLALSVLQRSLKLKETSFNTKWTGLILILAGDRAGAVQMLRKALALAPQDTQVLFNLGRVLIQDNRRSEAESVFRKLRSLAPGSEYTRVLQELLGSSG